MRIGDIAGLTLTLLCAAAPNSFAVETRDVPSFVETLTQYTNAADRPVLMLSRGTAIAWIPDPLHLPTNFNDYLSGDKQKLLPVSVGTAMVAFPPRGPQICRGGVLGVGQKCSPLPGTDRGMSSDFVLVLTADGLWGVLDRRRSVDVLNEDDLRRVATAEKSKPLARFVMTQVQIKNVDIGNDDKKLQDFMPQGQLLRIKDDESDPSKIIVDLGDDDPALKDSPAFKNMRAQFQKTAKSAGIASIADQFELPVGKVIHIQILERLVPADAADEWLSPRKEYSSDSKGAYSKILGGGVFAFTRVADGQDRQLGCDEEPVSKSNWETAFVASGGVSGKLTAKANFGYVGGTAELEASAKEELKKERTNSTSQVVKSHMWQSLGPVEIFDKDGGSSTFWAGKAKTCSDTTIWSLMADSTPPLVEPDAVYLHPNFDRLASSLSDAQSSDARASALEQLKAITNDLDQIRPGGNPFRSDTGVLNFKCLSQAIAFSNLLREKMAAASEHPLDTVVAVVIARATEPIRRNGDAMRAFGPDSACN
jgi:hypothetical protein